MHKNVKKRLFEFKILTHSQKTNELGSLRELKNLNFQFQHHMALKLFHRPFFISDSII